MISIHYFGCDSGFPSYYCITPIGQNHCLAVATALHVLDLDLLRRNGASRDKQGFIPAPQLAWQAPWYETLGKLQVAQYVSACASVLC